MGEVPVSTVVRGGKASPEKISSSREGPLDLLGWILGEVCVFPFCFVLSMFLDFGCPWSCFNRETMCISAFSIVSSVILRWNFLFDHLVATSKATCQSGVRMFSSSVKVCSMPSV